MDYTKITNESSSQYKLLHSGKIKICEDGLLRDKEGRVAIAIGQYYASVGDKLTITTSEDNVIYCIVLDVKAKQDTLGNAIQKHDGSLVEFVVNTSNLPKKVRESGNMSNFKGMNGNVIRIEKG